jgi:DNA-binding NarL/FixJ family response regulator
MLTPRQAEIAQLVAQGMSYKAVAREVGVSVFTVRNHVMEAASRIPFDGKPRHRITVWVLSLDVEES